MKNTIYIMLTALFLIKGLCVSAQYNVNYGYSAGNSGNYNTAIGYQGLDLVTGNKNTSLGAFSGLNLTSGYENVFVGSNAGRLATTGYYNSFSGNEAGYSLTSGYYNTYNGWRAGYFSTTGYGNTFLGAKSGYLTTSGSRNIYIGNHAGVYNTTGVNNVFIGYSCGVNNTGSNNIFIGMNAGYYESGSDKLIIENSTSSTPLIFGDFENDIVKIGGRMGVNTQNVPDSIQLAVNGTIVAKEVIITVDNFPDYVFSCNYKLKPLNEVQDFIIKNGHLPGVPSANEVKTNGVKMGEMDKMLLEKIEELTLYLIDLQRKNDELTQKIEEISNTMHH